MIEWLANLHPLIHAAITLAILGATTIAITASEAANQRRQHRAHLEQRRRQANDRWRPNTRQEPTP